MFTNYKENNSEKTYTLPKERNGLIHSRRSEMDLYTPEGVMPIFNYLVPFPTWLTRLHRSTVHNEEPKNHQQKQKKSPCVSAVVARWTIPHRHISVRKENRTRVLRRRLHFIRPVCAP